MPFSRRSRRFFEHVDDSFFVTPCHFDRLPILVLAELITFEPFNKHQKHSSESRKTRGHSGHLLNGRKRRGDQGPSSASRALLSYVLKHLSLIILTILKLLHGSLDHISMLLNLLCLNDSLVEQGISKYMLMSYGLTHRNAK